MIFTVVYLLLPLWFVRNIKYILFWLYLWQLKQYHKRRFLDHFGTGKGKKLLLQPLQIFKLVLLIVFLIGYFVLNSVYLLLLPLVLYPIYFLEILLYFKAIFAKRTRSPKMTAKIGLLLIVSVLVITFIPLLIWIIWQSTFLFALSVLAVDIFLPLIVSLIVLIIQPIADYHRLSLQKKAKAKMAEFSPKVIGITGSYGKTSTKNYLTKILSKKFKVLSTKEHQNTEVGIPKLILKDLSKEHEVLIIEMGAYDKGTIKKICEFTKPDIGIVTGVNEQHLSLFGSMENLLSAEGGRELASYLEKNNGLLVLNSDNSYCLDLYNNTGARKQMYSLKKETDAFAQNIKVEKVFSSFNAVSKGKKEDFKIEVKGGHNILNILACVLVAKELGMSLKEVSLAAHDIADADDSIKLLKTSKGINILDSTYSANPDGVIADLDYLNIYPARKIIVMPCIIELGGSAKDVHRKIGAKIAEVCDLAIITAKEYFEDIKKGAMNAENILLVENPELVVEKINSFCKKGDTVLLEGRIPEGILKKIQ